MTQWIELVMTHMLPWPIGVLVGACALSMLIGLMGLWSLWRVRQALQVVPAVQDCLHILINSVALLTDTTESCFRAVSMQLQFMQSPSGEAMRRPLQAEEPRPLQGEEPPPEVASMRNARQRRVVGAARRGEDITAIAARENLAESEIALRLHVSRDKAIPEANPYGRMFT